MPFFKHTHSYGQDQEPDDTPAAPGVPAGTEEQDKTTTTTQDQRRRNDVLDATITSLRDAGTSWAEIGKATGLSKSGARQRWLRINGVPRARDV
jgi:hypothetical protein